MATTAKKSVAATAPLKTVAAKKTPATKAVAQKPSTTPARKTPVVAKKPTAPEVPLKSSTAPKPVLSAEQRNHYVAVAAFYIAERRGFTLGHPQDDWLAAEAEIDRLIASGHFSF